MTPEGIEPSTFGFGIRRATNYAMESIFLVLRPFVFSKWGSYK